jgi:hypothetical protein
MPVTIAWDNEERTILRQTYQGNWTNEEYIAAARNIIAVIDGSPHKVYLIVDFSKSTTNPRLTLSAMGAGEKQQTTDKTALIVLYRVPVYVRLLLGPARIIVPDTMKRLVVVDTEEEAYAAIYRHMHAERASSAS